MGQKILVDQVEGIVIKGLEWAAQEKALGHEYTEENNRSCKAKFVLTTYA